MPHRSMSGRRGSLLGGAEKETGMTDQNGNTPATTDDVVVVAGVIADEQGILAEGAVAAPDGAHALVVARFATPDAARLVYDDLLFAELDGAVHIDGVLVVNAESDGRLHVQKMTDHSTRTGLKWGIVGGVVAGIFLPATIFAGAAALGAAGLAAGKARNLSHRLDVEHELAGVITPNTSGILAPRDRDRTRPGWPARCRRPRRSRRSRSTRRPPPPSRKPPPPSRPTTPSAS